MHVQIDARLRGLLAQPGRAARVLDLGAPVALRVAEEHLDQGHPALAGLPDRVGLIDMGTDGDLLGLRGHVLSLGARTDHASQGPARVDLGFVADCPGHAGPVHLPAPLLTPALAEQRLGVASVLLLAAVVLLVAGLLLLRRR